MNDLLITEIQDIESLLKSSKEEALSRAEKLISEHPNSEDSLLLLARCQRYCAQLDLAHQTLDKLIESYPNNIIAYMELATVLNQKEMFSEAIHTLRTASTIAPEIHEIWDLLSQHLFQSGDKDGAKDALNQYKMIKEFNIKLAIAQEQYQKGELKEVGNICQHLLSLIPTEIRALKLHAKILSHYKEFEKSIATLEYCILQQPSDMELGIQLLNAIIDSGNKEKAIKESERLVKLDSKNQKLNQVIQKMQSL